MSCEHHACEGDDARWVAMFDGERIGAFCAAHVGDAIEDFDVPVILEPA